MRSERLYDFLTAKYDRALGELNDEEDVFDLNEDTETDAQRKTKTSRLEFANAEFLIAARLKPSNNSGNNAKLSGLSDWVPVAQLCITRHRSDSPFQHLPTAISLQRRELYAASKISAPMFSQTDPSSLEYSAEPMNSFGKYVYDEVVDTKAKASKNKAEVPFSKAEARKIMGLEEGCDDKTMIKGAYRKLSMKMHPDKFGWGLQTPEEKEVTDQAYADMKRAYETLISGMANKNADGKIISSWYESLGGKERTDFQRRSDG